MGVITTCRSSGTLARADSSPKHRPRREKPMSWKAIGALIALALAVPAHAQPVEEFYRNRIITILVGFTAGGGYDLYARLLGRHMGRHVPGNPAIVVQNMPGAGSLTATQFVYSVAPR